MSDIQIMLHKQREYFNKGETLSEKSRRLSLLRLKKVILKRQEDITTALRIDLNKSPMEAYMTEISVVIGEIDSALKLLHSHMKKHHKSTPMACFPAKSYTIFEPYGVVLILSPWNYPFQLAIAPIVGAIAAGNCVMLKTSPNSTATAKVVDSIITEVFSPCHVVSTDKINYEELLQQRYDYIFFTGSERVGKIVMSAAAVHLTPVSLELGGKSPCIVEKSADIELAARRIVWGKLLNSGQTCVAPDYILVDVSIKVLLIEAIAREIKRQYGEPLSNPEYPKIVSRQHYERLLSLLSGEVITGGECDETTLRIAPTMIIDAKWECAAMQDEIFGPILPILSFTDIAEVIVDLKNKPKPLACYLFTKNSRVKDHLLKFLPFGGGCINDTVMHLANCHLPFGGVGSSGIGQYHGQYSLVTFSHEKAVLENGSIDVPFRYRPYSEKTKKLLKRIL